MSSSAAPSKQKFDVTIALPYIFSVIMLAVVGFLLSAPHLALKDLPEFYAPGRMLLAGTPADVYKAQALETFEKQNFPEAEAPILYIPPHGLPLLAPLGFLPVPLADPVWFAVLILCTFASIVFLKKALGLQHKHVMRIAGVLCASGPEWEAIRHGQLASVMLLSLSIAFFLFSREKWIALGSSANEPRCDRSTRDECSPFQCFLAALALTPLAAKPQLFVPMLVALAGAGRHKVLLFLGGIVAILNIVAFEIFGSDTFAAYFNMVHRGKDNRIWLEDMTPTVRGQLMRLFPHIDGSVVSFVVLGLGMICIFLIARKYRTSPFWWEYIALAVMPIALPTALHAHVYDWLLLLPTILVFIFGRVTSALTTKQKVLWMLPVAPLMMPLYNKIQYEYFSPGVSINVLFWDISAVAVAITIWLLFRYKESIPTVRADTDSGALT